MNKQTFLLSLEMIALLAVAGGATMLLVNQKQAVRGSNTASEGTTQRATVTNTGIMNTQFTFDPTLLRVVMSDSAEFTDSTRVAILYSLDATPRSLEIWISKETVASDMTPDTFLESRYNTENQISRTTKTLGASQYRVAILEWKDPVPETWALHVTQIGDAMYSLYTRIPYSSTSSTTQTYLAELDKIAESLSPL